MKTIAEIQEMAHANAVAAIDQRDAGIYRDSIKEHATNVMDTCTEWRAWQHERFALDEYYLHIASLLNTSSSAPGPSQPAERETAPAADNGGRTSPMKLSTWLREYTDSHAIFNHQGLCAKFVELTGKKPCWPVHTAKETAEALSNDVRGVTINYADPNERVAYGYEIAEAVARYYAKHSSQKLGRGFRWRDCVEALERAGL